MNRTMTRTRIGLLTLLLFLLPLVGCGRQNGGDAANKREAVVTTANTTNQTNANTASNANAAQAVALQQTGADTPSQQLLAQLYNQILPSVVDIQVTATTEQADTGLFPFLGGQQQPRQVRGEGTGWVYDDQGHIVTNNHVVENATEITVNFSDGSWATGIGVHDQ